MLWKALGGAVIAAVAFIAGCTTISIVASGCRLFSVDQDEFVHANRVVLDVVPVYPGSPSHGGRLAAVPMERPSSVVPTG